MDQTVTCTGGRLLTYKTHGQEKKTQREKHGEWHADASVAWPSVWNNYIHLETV